MLLRRFATLLLTVATASTLTSCATIASDMRSPLKIDCNIEGSRVRVFDQESAPVFEGETPCSVVLDHGSGYFRGAQYRVEVTSDGFVPREFMVNTKLNEWYLGNAFLPGGFIGSLLVDPFTGAMFRLDTNDVRVELEERFHGHGMSQLN